MYGGAGGLRVLVEERHPGEGLVAGGAGVLLDVGVRLEVSPEVAAVGEAAVALRALEGLLSRVGSDVALQEPRAREGLSAQVALARQGVGADVHLEGAQARVHLVAVLAAEGLGSQGRAVELLVFAEAGVGGVGLCAFRAGVPRFSATAAAAPITGS